MWMYCESMTGRPKHYPKKNKEKKKRKKKQKGKKKDDDSARRKINTVRESHVIFTD